jgi:hypothetical protein
MIVVGKAQIDAIADKAARLKEASEVFEQFISKAKAAPISREEFVTFVNRVTEKLADAGDVHHSIMAMHLNPRGGPAGRR